MVSSPISGSLRAGVAVVVLCVVTAVLPQALTAQTEMPSAEEVREALETLRRFERALARDSGQAMPKSHRAIGASGREGLGDLPSGDAEARSNRFASAVLTSDTVGITPALRTVVAPGSYALSLDGAVDLGGYVFKEGYPFLHNDGGVLYGNTALGINALTSATPGSPNSVDGSRSTAVGNHALANNTTGNRNTAMGHVALLNNTEGSYNTATGSHALGNNSTGSYNTAVGHVALLNNTEGSRNTAMGTHALSSNTLGSRNTATGYQALYSNTLGVSNTATGTHALSNNTTGTDNTASGLRSLYSNTDGYGNTANGNWALYYNTSGRNNTAVGRLARYANTIGSLNTAIGPATGWNWTTGHSNIAIGRGAYGAAEESSVIRIGGTDLQTKPLIEGISATARRDFG